MEHPDPKWHLRISIAKSILRIVAGTFLVFGSLFWAGAMLIAAETLGVLEELV